MSDKLLITNKNLPDNAFGLVFETKGEAECCLKACKFYAESRQAQEKPTSTIDGIIDSLIELLNHIEENEKLGYFPPSKT